MSLEQDAMIQPAAFASLGRGDDVRPQASGPRPSDGQLVAAVLAGEREQYAVLYDRYARLVRAVCHDETRHLQEAQDLAQDVFLRAFDRLPQLRDRERFAGWLLSMARHMCLEWRRRMRLRATISATDVPEATSADADEADVTATELHAALCRLPERERLALHMFYLQEQPASQARQLLDLSPAGFYKLLERARGSLARLLRKTQE